MKQKLKGKPFTVVGNGQAEKRFLNVKDVANAFYLAAKSKYENQIYNLGSGKPQKILDLVKLLKGRYEFIPKRPGEPNCTWST